MQVGDPILIVDDSAAMRQTVKSTLIGMGYQNVHIATNGAEALAQCKHSGFKLIFLDWNMPEMNGLDFLKAYRANVAPRDSAVVMLTASGDRRSILTAMENGATDYVIKPVSVETIKRKINQISAWFARAEACNE